MPITQSTSDRCHVVQVSYDDALFGPNGPEPLARQRLYATLLRELEPVAHSTVLVLTRLNTSLPIQEDGLTILPIPRQTAGKLGRIGWWRALYATLRALNRVRPITVITAQALNEEAWVAYLFGQRYGVPMVGQAHFDPYSRFGQVDNFGRGLVGKVRAAMSFALVSRLDAVRTVGRSVERRLLEEGATTLARTIPVPMPMVAKYTADVPEDVAPRVLFVGRLCPQKNLDMWLEIARYVISERPDAVFDIVGDGQLREVLEKQAAQAGIERQVRFRGFVPYEELSDIYRESSVFLLTSHYEGFGRVLVEAGACGVPAVAPRLSGVEDIIVDGETGFLVDDTTVDEYAARVLALLNDGRLRRRLGNAAALRVRADFDPQMLARQWVSLLHDVATERTRLPR